MLVLGGHDGTSEATLATAELFDPATGAFSPTGSMTEPRYGATATLLPDGRVLVVAGYKVEGETLEALATAELFDPETGRFSPAGSLAGPRTSCYAVALPDGRAVALKTDDGAARARPVLMAAALERLGVPDEDGEVVLLEPDRDVPLGGRMF